MSDRGESLRAALGFLTIVRVGRPAPPDRGAARWFAPVGMTAGLVVGGVWWGAAEIWPPLLAAVVAVAADAVLTGMLHLDGLGDTADGLLPPLERERRLEVMADPRAGGFAVVTVVLVLALRIGALAATAPDPLLVAGLWGLSRAGMALVLATMPYARREGGLATAFRGPLTTSTVLGLALAGLLVLVALSTPSDLVVLASAAAAFAAVVALARRRLGGYTGDVLGGAGVLAETAGLLAAASRW